MASFTDISTNQIDSYILVVGEANARQLGPRTTRTESTRTVVKDLSDRSPRLLEPYGKTTDVC
jgi:hypothetical protein